MQRILGIDPGLATLGYGVLDSDGSRVRHVAHGTFRTPSADDIGPRLLAIHAELNRILILFQPDAAGVEQVFFARNVRSAIPVAQARGVVLMSLAAHAVSFGEYSPLQVKQSILGRGNGRADKSQMMNQVRLLFGLEAPPSTDHAADALAIAYCHLNYSQVTQILKAQLV